MFFEAKIDIFLKLAFLHNSLYFGQFLNYIDPIYHFGILKVSSLSTHIDKSRIFSIKSANEIKCECHFFCITLYIHIRDINAADGTTQFSKLRQYH